MTDAPDPGLTDLIAAHQWIHFAQRRNSKCACGWQGDDPDYPSVGHPAHVTEVLAASYIVIELPDTGGSETCTSPAQSVEQHTNGRIAELEAELEKYHGEERRELEWARNRARDDVRCPSCNLRYGERDQYGCIEPARVHEYDADELRAALEGEQQ